MRLLLALCGAAATGPPAAAQTPETWIGVPLAGSAMAEAVADSFLVGAPPDTPAFVLRFATGGTVTFVDDRRRGLTGTWQAAADRLCVRWPDAAEPACQRLWLDGDRITFTDSAGQAVAETHLRFTPPPWAADLFE